MAIKSKFQDHQSLYEMMAIIMVIIWCIIARRKD